MRNAVNWTRYGAVGIAVGLLGACAHEKPAAVAQTPPPPPVEAAPPPEMVEVKVAVIEEDIGAALNAAVLHFDFDKDILKPESQDKLQQLAGVLQRHPGVAIQIQGNCDERGTEEYNLQLGQRRASVAMQYLVKLGNRCQSNRYHQLWLRAPRRPTTRRASLGRKSPDDFVRTQKISTR